MKITSLYKISLITALAGIIATGIVSCKKYNDWDTDESASRLFRPTSAGAVVDGIAVTLRWKAKPGTTSYTIETSQDSLQFATIIKTYSVTNVTKDADGYSNFIIPERLEALTRYSARIKGLDTTATKSESEWVAVTYKTATEQLMSPVTDADKTPYTVTLNWKKPNDVSHFILVNSQGVGTRYDITDSEKAAGSKVIENLTPTKAYTVILYYNALIRGTQTFTLPADLPKGPNVIYVAATDDLATMLLTVKDGTIFVLRQGTKYNVASTPVNPAVNPIILPDGVSFTIWGEGGANKPIIAFNGITLPASAGTIRFENLDISGYENGDVSGVKRNYIFNQSTASTTSEIIFESCTIRNMVNSPMRIQGASVTINKFTFNNCLIYDIGDNTANGTYALIHNSVATSTINNITITNSTIAKIGHSVIFHNVSPSQTVKISDNTFYNVTGNARYFIDYNTQPISGGFTFTNNIISKTLSPAISARGIRAGTVPTVSNTYVASDVTFTSNAIPNAISYTKPGTDLFTDVTTNNFLIKDVTFAGKSDSGDPRWRQ